jgi:hypothetical protein
MCQINWKFMANAIKNGFLPAKNSHKLLAV